MRRSSDGASRSGHRQQKLFLLVAAPWLALKQAGFAFEEVRISLDSSETRAQILAYSPSGKVPVLTRQAAHLGIARYL